MKKILSFILLLALTFSAHAQVKSLQHKEEKRRYIVYIPPAYHEDINRKFPVVFNFHGGGMTMAEQMLYTQMNKTADKHGFIVVYPQGIKQDWNVGFGMSYKEGSDDIGFVDALLQHIQKEYRTDTGKVYATGLSRGGFFCYRIAVELAHRFAAIAAVGATLPEPVVQHHNDKKKIGVMLTHGTADKVVLFEGKKDSYLSAKDTFHYWRKHNQIPDTATRSRKPVVDTADISEVSILETVEDQAHARHKTMLLTIQEGGHTWAGADSFNIGLPIGKTSQQINLNESIWQFFRLHALD